MTNALNLDYIHPIDLDRAEQPPFALIDRSIWKTTAPGVYLPLLLTRPLLHHTKPSQYVLLPLCLRSGHWVSTLDRLVYQAQSRLGHAI